MTKRGTDRPPAAEREILGRRHVRWGCWSLLVFLTLGLVLEAFHALKVPGYLDVGMETRRLMWTLAHAHGTLVALIHLAYGALLLAGADVAWQSRFTSPCLIGSSLLLPGGFLLGGLTPREGDPGLGILLVPLGGGMLLVAVLLMALACTRAPSGRSPE